MVSTKFLPLLVLIAPVVFAQRGGAHAGGGHATAAVNVRISPIHSTRFGGLGERYRFGRYALGYGWWPYLPTWDYTLPPPDYADDINGPYRGYPSNAPQPEPPPKPASAVIHEYSFGAQSLSGFEERPVFTIVLKDGSTRSAEASWVADGKLHYLDSHSRTQVLSAESIDRSASDRANQSKNLHMDLPSD